LILYKYSILSGRAWSRIARRLDPLQIFNPLWAGVEPNRKKA
jgi:hypothetical protein